MAGMSGRLAFASAARRDRRDVSGGFGLAGPASRRRARRHDPARRHGVSRAPFDLCRFDGGDMRRAGRGGPARLPGHGDRAAFPVRAHGCRRRRPRWRGPGLPSHGPDAPGLGAGSGGCGRAGRVQRGDGPDHRRLAGPWRSGREALGGGRREGGDKLSGRRRRGRGGGAGDPRRRRLRDARL